MKMNKIEKYLDKLFPDPKCELNYNSPFQLLVATILSAQSTDKKVNEITETLFKDYPDLDAFLTLSNDELEERIKQIGLYRNKSKNIILMCRQLKEKFNGEVPKTMEGIMSLAGAGRKTANVVLSNAFGVPSIAVDTHVFRVANRLDLAKSDNVLEVEIKQGNYKFNSKTQYELSYEEAQNIQHKLKNALLSIESYLDKLNNVN